MLSVLTFCHSFNAANFFIKCFDNFCVVVFLVGRRDDSSFPLQRGPSGDATRCTPAGTSPWLHVWGKTAGERLDIFFCLFFIQCNLFLVSEVVVLTHYALYFSKEMATTASKALLGKEKVWFCWCSEGRHATWACTQNHQGPRRHD